MKETDVDELVRTLQARVAQRRAAGEYPPGLEEQLEAEFEQIMKAVHRHELDTDELRRRVDVVGEATSYVSAEPRLESRVPGGSTVHTAAARLVRRHTSTLAESVRGMGNEITRALQEVQRLIEAQREADQRQLADVVASVIDRIALLDHLADAVIVLEQRVDSLEASAER